MQYFLSANDIKVSIFPLNVIVAYKDGRGMIRIVVNYQTDVLFDSTSDYHKHRQSWERIYSFSNGVSLWGVKQLMSAIHNYKRQVELESKRNEIGDFDLCVRLIDNTGNWVQFYAYSYTNSGGFYQFKFYKNADIKFGKNPTMEVVTNNPRALNEIYLFYPGSPRGLDGNRAAAYYVYKFFNVEYIEPPK